MAAACPLSCFHSVLDSGAHLRQVLKKGQASAPQHAHAQQAPSQQQQDQERRHADRAMPPQRPIDAQQQHMYRMQQGMHSHVGPGSQTYGMQHGMRPMPYNGARPPPDMYRHPQPGQAPPPGLTHRMDQPSSASHAPNGSPGLPPGLSTQQGLYGPPGLRRPPGLQGPPGMSMQQPRQMGYMPGPPGYGGPPQSMRAPPMDMQGRMPPRLDLLDPNSGFTINFQS